MCFGEGKISSSAFIACHGGGGVKLKVPIAAFFKNSSIAAKRHPLKRGCEKTRVMVGSWGGRLALKLTGKASSH
jgi:hypothetical protein